MPRLNLMACLALGALTSCCTNPKDGPGENAEVAARCPPVRDLLAKNYHRDGRVDLAVVKAGSLYDRRGVVLTSEEAARAAQTDALCRAWVFKAITPREYAQAILKLAAVTVVETSSPVERDAVTASMARLLEDLKTRGLLPRELDTADLQRQVAADARLTRDQLDESLRQAMGPIATDVQRFTSDGAQGQAELLRRLQSLDDRLARLEAGRGGPPTTPGAGGPASLEVYFATGSAELTFDARSRLRDAAREWAAASAAVSVVGYSDPRGDGRRNQALSLARAEAVAALLGRFDVKVGDVRGGGVGSGADDNDLLRVVRIRRATP